MMKRVVTLMAALVLGGAVVQDASAQQNLLGVKAGYVMADVSVDDFDTDSRSGIGFGAFLQVPIGGSLSVQPEALYLPKGFKTEDLGIEFEAKAAYLQVPILVQYHFQTGGNVAPRLFAGPSIAFELSCDIEATDGVVSAEDSCDSEEFEFSTKSADFGLVFGAGVDLPLGSMVLTLDGRYDLGVTNILDEGEEEVQNRAWEFFAGLGFPMG